MRDIVYNVFDIISYFVQGMLLVTLLKEAQPHFPWEHPKVCVNLQTDVR